MYGHKFKVGDKVTLKMYGPYTDYQEHKDQVATITSQDGLILGEYKYFATWPDGSESSLYQQNMQLVEDDDFSDIKVGEFLVNKYANELEVLFVTDKIVVVDDGYPEDAECEVLIRARLQKAGYTKQAQAEEMTVEEISEVLGKKIVVRSED